MSCICDVIKCLKAGHKAMLSAWSQFYVQLGVSLQSGFIALFIFFNLCTFQVFHWLYIYFLKIYVRKNLLKALKISYCNYTNLPWISHDIFLRRKQSSQQWSLESHREYNEDKEQLGWQIPRSFYWPCVASYMTS